MMDRARAGQDPYADQTMPYEVSGSAASSLRRQYEVAKRRNAKLPDSMSLAPRTPEGRKASGHAERP